MFSDLKNLFDPSKKKWLWMSDKEHATGTLKNYCFPFCRPQVVTRSELNSLPYKYMVVGTGQYAGVGESCVCAKVNETVVRIDAPSSRKDVDSKFSPATLNAAFDGDYNSKVANFINSKPLEQPLLGDKSANVNSQAITVYTNVCLTQNMLRLLHRLHKQGELGAEAWREEAATEGALQLIDDLRAEFRNCERLVCADGPGGDLERNVSGKTLEDPKKHCTTTPTTVHDSIMGA